ncbi:MAG: aspartate aminotransferase [Nitrospirae bacterium CG_4_9_14_3_um_filter_53_35]|nr:MAG: aspartate aminotransferase [Nitrospirae bacterium CG2_30_53_67]PIS38056.1 MAG: aspartate aminotransferase [Nitrospirae bacterium CG08_land_8_20_14_0_20_52_24]PIV85674.1 MAG: aspartate aminotransferase [Nitrospirae bacterium CG17_big_fil_post_rev_8_21_14_2_50_50_9]PIW85423.1 MAG: aspartate aminotransferase [Nitrospirae bacterium CG_4_8_14_3_um_filter_50_41]PIX86209.1 MAG: aspartate aminotransferase [Nitrospirae bacterium CG_4_10_14_3_um_filter_53_41]PJA74788.1 MAG: aspartate aminotransf
MKSKASRVSVIKPSVTLAIDAKAKELRAQGVDIVGFGAGEPDFDTPNNIKEAAVRALNAGFTKYTPASGTLDLKKAVCEKMKRDNGLDYKPSQVLISCGAKHALYNTAQALYEPGDEVIIPAPYWVSYPDQVLLQGAVPRIVETREAEKFRLTGELLRRSLSQKTKALILNSPSNPTGCGYTLENLKELAEVIVEHDIYVISDEIYEKLVYGGFEFHSIAELGEEVRKRTIIINGVSKSHAMTGWRIGWAVGPSDVIKSMSDIQSQSTSNPNSIAQKAAEEALNGPQDTVEKMVKEFDQRRQYIVDRLNAMEGISCLNPEGAFYVFPKVSAFYGRRHEGQTIRSSVDLCDYLLNIAQAAAVPGSAFGADAYIRLSYATSMEMIQKGLNRIEEALKRLI